MTLSDFCVGAIVSKLKNEYDEFQKYVKKSLTSSIPKSLGYTCVEVETTIERLFSFLDDVTNLYVENVPDWDEFDNVKEKVKDIYEFVNYIDWIFPCSGIKLTETKPGQVSIESHEITYM